MNEEEEEEYRENKMEVKNVLRVKGTMSPTCENKISIS